MSEGESNPPLSYASRAVPFGTCKVHLATLSRAYRHPPRSLRTSCEEERFFLGAKHPYHTRLLRYSVGSLPAAPPRIHQYEGRSLQVTSSPLCCEVWNRTRHRAKCSISDTSIIQRGRRAYCYHSATHYRPTHIPPKTSIVYISSTVRNRTSSFFENHQRWPLL